MGHIRYRCETRLSVYIVELRGQVWYVEKVYPASGSKQEYKVRYMTKDGIAHNDFNKDAHILMDNPHMKYSMTSLPEERVIIIHEGGVISPILKSEEIMLAAA